MGMWTMAPPQGAQCTHMMPKVSAKVNVDLCESSRIRPNRCHKEVLRTHCYQGVGLNTKTNVRTRKCNEEWSARPTKGQVKVRHENLEC